MYIVHPIKTSFYISNVSFQTYLNRGTDICMCLLTGKVICNKFSLAMVMIFEKRGQYHHFH